LAPGPGYSILDAVYWILMNEFWIQDVPTGTR